MGLFEAGALVAEGGGFEAEAVEADEATMDFVLGYCSLPAGRALF